MAQGVHIVLAALLLVSTVSASNGPYPVVGCWERSQLTGKHPTESLCIQYFGFQNIESINAVTVEPGFDNYMLVNERPMHVQLPTTFPGQTEVARAVNVTVPCTQPGSSSGALSVVQWVLNGHLAVSTLGQIGHYCNSELASQETAKHRHGKSHKAAPAEASVSWDSAHVMHETHPYRAEEDLECIQVQLSKDVNGGCARLPLLDPDTLHSVKVLDVELSTQPSGCVQSGSAPLALGITLSAGCRAAPLTHRDMFSMSAPCALSHAWFGLDWSVERPWPAMAAGDMLPDTGLAYRPVAQRDEMSAALRQALIATEQDHGSQDSLFVRLYASGDEVQGTVHGATLRVCSRVGVRHVSGVRAVADGVSRLEPLFDCTSRIDTTQCVSHFGYHLYGTSEQHRPISASNTFAEPPYDRGQPVRFHPGEHHNVFSVVWNCSDTANQALPAIAWQADGTATANRRMPLCRIGCDGSSDGSKHYDTCGVCGGDGSSCRHSPRAVDQQTERKFCDGDNERSHVVDFENELPANIHFGTERVEAWNLTISSDGAALVLLDSSAPPAERADLGTPNNHHSGPGTGVGGANSNADPLGLVLAFESAASSTPGCMRFSFDRPSSFRGVQLLNIPSFCADLSVTAGTGDFESQHQVSVTPASPLAGLGSCTSNVDCVDAVCVSGTCVRLEMVRGGGGGDNFNWNPNCDRCRKSSDCDDGLPCTADVCVNGMCHHPVDEYCCEHNQDCERPLNPCEEAYCSLPQHRCHTRPVNASCCSPWNPCAPTSSACTQSLCVNNQCQQAPVQSNGECCDTAQDCLAETCVAASCQQNQCVRTPVPGCCSQNAPCAAGGQCVSVQCQQTQCVYDSVPGCCESNVECAVPNICISSSCVANTCVFNPVPNCCLNNAQCISDDPCVLATCGPNNQCTLEPIAGCCLSDAACPDSPLQCVDSFCNLTSSRCVDQAIQGCCRNDTWCDDNNACTVDVCGANKACTHTPISNCCRFDFQCNDNNPCTEDHCAGNNTCTHTPIPQCCTSTSQCPNSTFPCADYVCDSQIQRCVLEPVGQFCCTAQSQCEVTSSECVTGVCNVGTNECLFAGVPGCCSTDSDCGIPSNPCLTGVCSNGDCVVTEIDCDDNDACTDDVCQAGQCINTPKQCGDDFNSCTDSTCVNGLCLSLPNVTRPGCCNGGIGECEDRGPCVVSQCTAFNCVYLPVADGCCENVTDCASIIKSVPACSQRACNNNQCVVVPDPTCCFADAECPLPGQCQVPLCINGTCSVGPDPLCCQDVSDCRVFPADACLDLTDCVNGTCQYESRIPCCAADADCSYLLEQVVSLSNASCYAAQCNATSGLCELADICPPCDYCTVASDCEPHSLCTVSTCVDSVCQYAELDCNDDRNCTIDACAGGLCVYDDSACPCEEVLLDPAPLVLALRVTVRDFQASHPNFEEPGPFVLDPGIVEPFLGPDLKPVFAGPTPSTTTQAAFDQWFRDVPGVNFPFELDLTLDRIAVDPLDSSLGLYVYANANYFPIDGQGFGNGANAHNYHFTTEIHADFIYTPGSGFAFIGDDDVWVFLNGVLIVDLGGVHPPAISVVSFDTVANATGLVPGKKACLDLFHAERHTVQSNFAFIVAEKLDACGIQGCGSFDQFKKPLTPGTTGGLNLRDIGAKKKKYLETFDQTRQECEQFDDSSNNIVSVTARTGITICEEFGCWPTASSDSTGSGTAGSVVTTMTTGSGTSTSTTGSQDDDPTTGGVSLTTTGIVIELTTTTTTGTQPNNTRCTPLINPPAIVNVTAIFHDFNDTHPDFEKTIATETGIVSTQLGPDGLPVYAGPPGGTLTVSGNASFWQWYRDTPGVNKRVELQLPLTRGAILPSGAARYSFFDDTFFPLDGLGFGNQGRQHNYHFTMYIHGEFVYESGEVFNFVGDDDVWVFVNGKLVIDIGGVHPPLSGSAAFDSLGLVQGGVYPIDFFFAERHTVLSTFNATTTLLFCQASVSPTPSRSLSSSPSRSPSPTAQPTASATAQPTSTASATAQPTASATAQPTASATAQPTASATAQPTASATAQPTPSATARPSVSMSPSVTRLPTSTPAPTGTPSPSRSSGDCKCPHSQGYWKTHQSVWDQSLSLCNSTYAANWELHRTGRATPWLRLVVQWQAADLNARATASSPQCVPTSVRQDIIDGRVILERYCANRTIPEGADREAAGAIATRLESYNTNCHESDDDDDEHRDDRRAVGRSLLSLDLPILSSAQVTRCGFGVDCEQRPVATHIKVRTIPSGDTWDGGVRSWVALYDETGARVQRQPVPMSAADNGVSYVRFSDGPVVSSMEVCMCNGRGAVARLDYDYPGSGVLLDGCGRCNGTGTSCAYLPTDMVQPAKVATNPVVIREVENDSYRVCYIHRRTPEDRASFDGVAVRVGFSEPHVCGLRASGSCDSSLPVPDTAGQYCDMFGGPQAYLNPMWHYEPLSRECVHSAVDEDDLLECPIAGADASGGYRLCTTMSFAEMSRCSSSTGSAVLQSRDNDHDNGITHSGHIHAAEFRPVNCMSESSCEVVDHVSHRAFSLQTRVATATQFLLETSVYDFHATVTSVSCVANGAVRVSLNTVVEHMKQRVSAEPTTSVLSATVGRVHIAGPQSDRLVYVIAPGSAEVQLSPEHGALRFADTAQAAECTNSDHTCTQQWTLVLFNGQDSQRMDGELTIGFDVAVRGVSVDPAVVTLHLYVDCAQARPIGTDNEEAQALNARNAREVSVADSMLTLFRDMQHILPYTPSTPEGAVFLEGQRVYGHLAVALPEALVQHAHEPTAIELTDLILCYSIDNVDPYLPFDYANPSSTGCASPGEWITVSLLRHGQITSAGARVGLTVTTDDTEPLSVNMDWAARAATRHPVYVDARWRLLWQHSEARSVTAEDMASVRLAQHRSDALHNKRHAYDWKEELSVFHAILTVHQMEKTRHLPARTSVRTAMAIRNAQEAGMDPHELTRLLLGSAPEGVRVPDIPELPALRTPGLDLNRALNSPDDAVLVASVRDDAAVYPAFNDPMWEGGAQNAIVVACNVDQYPKETAEPPVEEYCGDCDDCDDHHGGFYVIPCYGWWGCGGNGGGDHDWWGYHGHSGGDWWWLLFIALACLLLCMPLHGGYLPPMRDHPRTRIGTAAVTNVNVSGRNNTAVVNTAAASQRRSSRAVVYGDA